MAPRVWNKRPGGRIYNAYESSHLCLGLFLSLAMSVRANVLLTMAVSPVQSFAPTNLTIRIHVEPDAGNRALEVVAESGEY